jgi:hypothetical protein
MRLCLIVLLAVTALSPAEQGKSRARELSEINAKIADLQRQMDYWQEKKRRLVDVSDAPPETKQGSAGRQVLTGPRNGKYHYSPAGRKVYERKLSEPK